MTFSGKIINEKKILFKTYKWDAQHKKFPIQEKEFHLGLLHIDKFPKLFLAQKVAWFFYTSNISREIFCLYSPTLHWWSIE